MRSCVAEMLGLDRTEMLDEGERSPWDGWFGAGGKVRHARRRHMY